MPKLPCFRLLLAFFCCFILSANLILAQRLDWLRHIGYGNDHYRVQMTKDHSGNLISSGVFLGALNFDPSVGGPYVQAPHALNSFVQKLDANGDYVWSLTFPGNQNVMQGVRTDAWGNLYVGGWFMNALDMDPGPGIDSALAPSRGMAIVLLDSNGGYRQGLCWPHNIMANFTIDDSSNLYLYGNFWGTMDFDLGPNLDTINSSLGYGFVAKYDSAGQLQWRHLLSPTSSMLGLKFMQNKLYLYNHTQDTFDYDFGPNTTEMSGFAFAQYDLNGQLIIANQFADSGYELLDIQGDAAGNHYFWGYNFDTTDFDLGPAVHTLTSGPNSSLFVAKLDANLGFQWAKQWDGGPFLGWVGNGFDVSSAGEVYVATSFGQPFDADPGIGTASLSPPTLYSDIAVLKLSAEGELIWANQIGNANEEWLDGISVIDAHKVLVRGKMTGTVDFGPGVGNTSLTSAYHTVDYFMLQLEDDSCAGFHVQIDSLQHVGCNQELGGAGGHASGGLRPYLYRWSTTPATLDSVASFVASGIYTLHATDANGCESSRDVVLQGPTALLGFDLDLQLQSGWYAPGRTTTLHVQSHNQGCSPTSGQVKLVIDPLLTFQSASPSPTSIVGDTLIWNFPGIVFGDSGFAVDLIVLTATTAQIGDSIHWVGLAEPILNDQNPADNLRDAYGFVVVGAYDPNRIDVFPNGICEDHFLQKDNPLTYTIQFQNTGTAEAWMVEIWDTLNSFLDIASVHVKDYSHPMHTEIMAGNTLRFVFDGIHLPDSSTDEAGSHGHVVFEIFPRPTVPTGTVIQNQAAIYFDYNAAVMTNFTANALVDSLPTCAVATQPVASEDFSWQIFPNPISALAGAMISIRSEQPLPDITVFDALGNLQYQSNSHGQHLIQVDIRTWPSGIYFVRVKGSARVKRLVVL